MKRLYLTAILTCAAFLAPAAAAQAMTVYAASSLTSVLPQIDGSPSYSFGGSNTLQAQIEKGAPADVFASASPAEAQALYHEGKCTKPVTFATNKLVLAVPQSGSNIDSIYDLKRGGYRLSIGNASVPIGKYTRKLLARMQLSKVLKSNTVSNESNVSQVVAKVALQSADAGFVYYTDAKAASGRIKGIALPRWAQPPVKYQACVVRRPNGDGVGGNAYLKKLTAKSGRKQLRKYGFGLPAKHVDKKKKKKKH
jgi:molybdate transport system substrate-binding protein